MSTAGSGGGGKTGSLLDSIIMDEAFVRRTLITMIVFFIVPLFLGLLLWKPLSGTILGKHVEETAKGVRETAMEFMGAKYFLLPLVIFARNTLVALVNALLSPLLVVPPLILAFNGLTVGFVILASSGALAAELGGKVGLLIVALLSPHGAIEIPAVSISASTVFYFVDYVRGVNRSFAPILKRNLILSITMLAFSALVETFITPVAAIIAMIIGSI